MKERKEFWQNLCDRISYEAREVSFDVCVFNDDFPLFDYAGIFSSSASRSGQRVGRHDFIHHEKHTREFSNVRLTSTWVYRAHDVKVIWRGGESQTIKDQSSNQLLMITEDLTEDTADFTFAIVVGAILVAVILVLILRRNKKAVKSNENINTVVK